MERFTRLEAVAVPIAQSHIDTDQIIPARFLKKPRKEGLGQCLFYDLRFHADGLEKTSFILNQAPYWSARIIVAEENFGCGSSRESAVWALYDYGFRVAIAPSFGDIFYNNCLKNGFLPIVLPPPVVAGLLASLTGKPGKTLVVDLRAHTVTLPDHSARTFDVEPFAKECLLNGLDELEYTLSLMNEIARFETNYGK
jgi:3-isopropylmalate/(R)-2-methylmalate dehydratase small subunit